MTEAELLKLIEDGENIRVEFKKSTTEITKDVYDTVCSFSNRDGGIILLGVKDNGEILGVAPDAIDRMKKDFVTSINNGQKINPPLYLQPEACTVDGRTLLVIQVPSGSQVCRHHGRIFDRSHEADIDITDNSDMVYQLYARKSGSYFVNKVTRFQMDDLRPDLMERARAMTTSRTANHPWKSVSDEELLRSAGLILKDPERQLEGITLAAILLFGKDSTILSVLPQHKTDAIFRVENLDRYDDRDVIITNLLETYDRLIAFGQKHLSDPFVQEGLQSVSARDRILREIFSNSLAHRDYSSGYVAKFVKLSVTGSTPKMPTVPTGTALCTFPPLSRMPRTRPFPKCSVRLDWRTSWGPGCGILTNTRSSIPVEPRNLSRAMCSAPWFRWPRLRWKRLGRRTRSK